MRWLPERLSRHTAESESHGSSYLSSCISSGNVFSVKLRCKEFRLHFVLGVSGGNGGPPPPPLSSVWGGGETTTATAFLKWLEKEKSLNAQWKKK